MENLVILADTKLSTMTEKSPLLLRLVTYAFSLFWGAVMLAHSLYLVVKLGPRKFFRRTKRNNRPLCLDDASLGIHSFARLKVSITYFYSFFF